MKLIAPSEFRATRWKNGKGVTTELAISERGTLADFDWRISMATVVEDGPFSNFSGFDRCLVLLAGSGMQLHHVSPSGHHTTHCLENSLDMAEFDGGSTTTAKLINGPIMDFNVMAKTGCRRADTRICCVDDELVSIDSLDTFVYAVKGETQVVMRQPEATYSIPQGHLLQLGAHEYSSVLVRGRGCIVIQIHAAVS